MKKKKFEIPERKLSDEVPPEGYGGFGYCCVDPDLGTVNLLQEQISNKYPFVKFSKVF